jgi:TRAP-type mannitol/chloroaromatic compound transport system permease small subunit
VLFLLPVCLFLGWTSWDYVTNSWSTLKVPASQGGLKLLTCKSIILVLVVSLVPQGISDLITRQYPHRSYAKGGVFILTS